MPTVTATELKYRTGAAREQAGCFRGLATVEEFLAEKRHEIALAG